MRSKFLKGLFSRKTLTVTQRIILVVLVLTGLGIATLKLTERSGESLRKGFQDYLAQATGHYAEITDLKEVKLFPQMDLSLDGVLLRDEKNLSHVILKTETLELSVPFWKLYLGMPRFLSLNIKNTEIASGFIFPEKTTITHALISDSGDINEAPVFLTEGLYAGENFLLTADMKRHGDTPPYQYSLNRRIPVSFKLGDLEARAVYTAEKEGGQLSDAEIALAGHTALLTIRKIQVKPAMHFEASGTVDGTAVNAVLTGSAAQYSLRISTPGDTTQDKKTLEAFVKSLNRALGSDKNKKGEPFVVIVEPSDPDSGPKESKE